MPRSSLSSRLPTHSRFQQDPNLTGRPKNLLPALRGRRKPAGEMMGSAGRLAAGPGICCPPPPPHPKKIKTQQQPPRASFCLLSARKPVCKPAQPVKPVRKSGLPLGSPWQTDAQQFRRSPWREVGSMREGPSSCRHEHHAIWSHSSHITVFHQLWARPSICVLIFTFEKWSFLCVKMKIFLLFLFQIYLISLSRSHWFVFPFYFYLLTCISFFLCWSIPGSQQEYRFVNINNQNQKKENKF